MSANRVVGGIDDLIDSCGANFPVIQLNQSAGIEKVAGQRSTFPSIGNNFGGHRSRNPGETPANLLKTGSRFSFLQLSFDAFNVLDGQIGATLSRSFDHAYQNVLMLFQIQWL
jgi:hypothetical protein